MTQSQSQSSFVLTGTVASEVSTLFRTKRVSEIRAYEQQIRAEADDKSDALRDLLGTRYKDLLLAADEIAAIRDASANQVRDALADMATRAAALRHHFDRRAAAPSAPAAADLDRRRGVSDIGSMLKNIVDTPEVLYACLESGDIYDAAVRYRLASRNYRQVTQTSGLEGAANRFAERRWRQVDVFRSRILADAEKQLVTPRLQTDVYAHVLASLILLTDDMDAVALLNGMLAARTGWIDDEHRSASGVVARMCAVARVVRSTISCAAELFWGDSVVALLQHVDDTAVQKLNTAREDGSLTTAVVNWTTGVNAWLDEHGASILAEASSSRLLADALRAVDHVFDVESWEEDCQKALQKPSNFVFDIFKPFISERASVVTSECIERAVKTVVSDIDNVWTTFHGAPHAGKLMWSTVARQTVELDDQSKQLDVNKKTGEHDDMEVGKMLASSGQVAGVLRTFEASLKEALDDTSVLTQRMPSVGVSFDKSVRLFMPRTLTALRAKLDLESQADNEERDSGSTKSLEQTMERALFVARAATSLGNAACVKSAYCMFSESNEEDIAALREFSEMATEICSAGYKRWANGLCRHLGEGLMSDLLRQHTMRTGTGWTKLESGEEGEIEEDNGEDSVGYPTTASAALVNFMLKACEGVNQAGGFALASNVTDLLREEVVGTTSEVYQKVVKTYGEEWRGFGEEVAFMQMAFDCLVLKEIFAEGEKSRKARFRKDLNEMESAILKWVDPVDFASCKRGLHDAVAEYRMKTSTVFGTICRASMKNAGQMGRGGGVVNKVTRTANVMELCRRVPRFTYLAAPMPSTYAGAGGGTAGLNARAAMEMLRSEATSANGAAYRKRDTDTSVAGYASKVSESVGRFGRGFFESLTRNVG